MTCKALKACSVGVPAGRNFTTRGLPCNASWFYSLFFPVIFSVLAEHFRSKKHVNIVKVKGEQLFISKDVSKIHKIYQDSLHYKRQYFLKPSMDGISPTDTLKAAGYKGEQTCMKTSVSRHPSSSSVDHE
ncbi:uncharacterized protein [Asterias amurensis]|uniref:uncharacterized protein n=1 Tax=Asterias amurensis TaxID=7602 RepID=UPI003AB6A0AF